MLRKSHVNLVLGARDGSPLGATVSTDSSAGVRALLRSHQSDLARSPE